MELVRSLEDITTNACRFAAINETSSSPAKKALGRFFHWYYFSDLSAFAPSKFIGYRDTTLENYIGAGTGTDTTFVLDRYFAKIARPSQEFDALAERLQAWLLQRGATLSQKTLNGTGGIYIRISHDVGATSTGVDSTILELTEGHPTEVRLTRFERRRGARIACLKHHGYQCLACQTDFVRKYGSLGTDFIHVHHLIPLAQIRKAYKVDPINDLIPLCPNCHAMIHRLPEPQTLDALRERLRADA